MLNQYKQRIEHFAQELATLPKHLNKCSIPKKQMTFSGHSGRIKVIDNWALTRENMYLRFPIR